MYDYSYPSANKRGYSEDVTYLPTAEKSHYRVETETYLDRTPQRNLFGSPARQSNSLSEARKSIDECIYMVSDKKKMNVEALHEVEQVNHQVLGFLTGYNPSKGNGYEVRNRTEDQYNRNNFRDNVVTSQFDFQPTFTSPKANYKNTFQESFGNQQNVELSSRLDSQINKNRSLTQQVNNLQAELTHLKASKGINTTNASINDLVEQNNYLRSQLAASSGNVPYNLIEELERLKAENNALRKDTVSLLRAKRA